MYLKSQNTKFKCSSQITATNLHGWTKELQKQLSTVQYNIINYHCHSVHYIPMTYLLYKFVPFDPLHQLCQLLPPAPASDNHQCVLCIYKLGFVCFLDFMYN